MLQVRNEKARRFLMNMRKKPRVNFEKYFVKADRGALRLLQRMLAFDPVERPTCEEALAGTPPGCLIVQKHDMTHSHMLQRAQTFSTCT